MQTLTTGQEDKLLREICPGLYDADKILKPDDYHPHTKRQQKQLRNLCITLLMLDCGLRVGEVVQICYTDLYFAGKPVETLFVRNEIAKRAHSRHVPLTRRLKAVLTTWLKIYLVQEFVPAPDLQTNLWLTKRPLTTRTIERIITSAAMTALGIPVNPHMLRHTYATKLMRVTDLRTVQELLGHKHVSSTQIYTHVNDEDKRLAVEKMQGNPSDFSRPFPLGQLSS